MREALAEAERALAHGDVPVGAVAVRDGTIVGRGHNRREADADPTAHAEMIVLTQAAAALESWRLDGVTVYVTLEPCLMCAGAMVHARVRRLVFGAYDPKRGAVNSTAHAFDTQGLNHRIEVAGGVLQQACSERLQAFFRARRA